MNRWGFIPPWAPLLVMVAVVFTGVVLGEISAVFLFLFVITCIVCTALVELRGLFLTVVMIPVYWFFGIGLIGYFADPESFSGANRRTATITAIYPAVENYLWLLAAFFVSLLIALVRQRLDAAARERARRIARQRRRRAAAADEDNRRVNSRVRDIERTADRQRERDRDRERQRSQAREAAPSGTQTATPRTTPRTVVRPRQTRPAEPEVRTRSAEELRAASERRRAREEQRTNPRHRVIDDRPLDLG